MSKVLKQISNSKLDLYSTCGKKFYFKYVEGLDADLTRSALLYGRAMDEALNYMLEAKRDNKEYELEKAKEKFVEQMSQWTGQNRLDYFKNEAPDDLPDDIPEAEQQELVWNNIVKRGIDSIDVYHKEIIPLFKRVIDVQVKRIETNADGDELIFIVDFIAEMQDGRVVVFDNKTASSKYKKKAVEDSQQLALYTEYFDHPLAGYIVLIKNPAKEKGMTHQILIGEIPEETRQKAFDNLEKALYNIKQGIFEKNEKGCFAFGKPCEYWKYCKQGNKEGLINRFKNRV